MPKLARSLLLVFVCLAGLAAAVLLALNIYVQSAETQKRIQQELSQRIGTSLLIQQISVTPWGGLKLAGISIPQNDDRVSEDFLSASTFRLRVAFSSLFGGRLVIKEVSIIKPQVTWLQNEDGKWRLPDDPVYAQRPPPEPDGQPEATAEGAPREPARVESRAAPQSSGFKPEVRRVNVMRGDFRFLNYNGDPVAHFSGVGFRSSFRKDRALRGDLRIVETIIRNRFSMQNLRSPLHYDRTLLELSDVTGGIAGGRIEGRFKMQPLAPDSPFEAALEFREVDIDQLFTEAGGPAGVLIGRLDGKLTAAGETADANALAGEGEIFLRDGQVQNYALLSALSQILQIEELAHMKFDQAHVKFGITPGVVAINELVFSSPDLRLSATGRVRFNGKLRLNAQLAISERVRGRLFSVFRGNFQPVAETGFSAVDFVVRGTVDDPKTNLMDRVVGHDLSDLPGVLRAFFGGRKEEEPKAEIALPPPPETLPQPLEDSVLLEATPAPTP